MQAVPVKEYVRNLTYGARTNNKKTAEFMVILSLIGADVSSFKFIGTSSPFFYEILDKVTNLKELKMDKDFATSQLTEIMFRGTINWNL